MNAFDNLTDFRHKGIVNIMQRENLRLLVVVVGCSFLAGCASVEVQKFAPIDQSNKTMTVPPGGGGLNGTIKKGLTASGWQLAVDRGPEVSQTQGSTLRTFDTFNTRYRMKIYENHYDWQFPDFDPMYEHDISVIDNRTGMEALTVSGRHAGKTITKKLMQALQN